MSDPEGRPPRPGAPKGPPPKAPASGTPASGTRPIRQTSSSQMRPVTARSGSSQAIPRGPSSTRRAPTGPHKAAEPEVLVSTGDEQSSTVRRRVSHAASGTPGLSLRWKIVLCTAGIAVATGIIVFLVVYFKAADQFNDEINAKGVALLNMLASIDEEYWLTAIHTREDSREAEFKELVTKLGGQSGWESGLRQKNLEGAYRRAVDPFSEAREVEIREVLNQAVGNTTWPTLLDGSPSLKRSYERIVRPLPALVALRPLRDLEKKKGKYGLLDAGVVDVTLGDREAPGVFLKGQAAITLPVPDTAQALAIKDAPRKEESVQIMSRTFIRNPDPNAPAKLRFYVSLSLAGIDDAQSALMWAILLPVFTSALLGVGIAIWISTRITEPIKTLMNDITEVSNGDLDHQTAVHSTDEVGLLAATFNKMTQALKLAHTQELEAKALEHDLSIASEIQSNLVPKRMLKIPGFDISAYYRPSKEVGGDYYDFITIDEDNEGVIVADVSGKGVPGSLVMSMARAFIRMEAERSRNTSPSDTLVRANRMLAQDIKKGMFVTALYCILNRKNHEIRVASAGHNPMVVWRAATNKIDLVNPSGIALGFDKGAVFERTIKEEKVVLGPGDRIVAYTDGVVEAMNADNQEFSDKRFYQLVQHLGTRDSNQMLNLIIKAIDEHRGDAPQSDDITIVTLRLL